MAGIRVPSRLLGVLAKKGGTGRTILTNFAILAAAFATVTAGSRSEAVPSESAGCAAFSGSTPGNAPVNGYAVLTTGFAVGDTLVVTGASPSASLSTQIYDANLNARFPTPPAAPASNAAALYVIPPSNVGDTYAACNYSPRVGWSHAGCLGGG